CALAGLEGDEVPVDSERRQRPVGRSLHCYLQLYLVRLDRLHFLRERRDPRGSPVAQLQPSLDRSLAAPLVGNESLDGVDAGEQGEVDFPLAGVQVYLRRERLDLSLR